MGKGGALHGPRIGRAACSVAITIFITILLIGCGSSASDTAKVYDGVGDRKAVAELEKLELEVQKLRKEAASHNYLEPYLTGEQTKLLLPFLAGLLTALLPVWGAWRARMGSLDQAVHQNRLSAYPGLIKAGARFAIYFPSRPVGAWSWPITPDDCRDVGKAMSQWYYAGGGLLLSHTARDAYFKLARALTLASYASELRVPRVPDDMKEISKEKVDKYRKDLRNKLGRKEVDNVETWAFGRTLSAAEAADPGAAFCDYVILQTLVSDLRTKLSKDLRSRRAPS